LSARARAEVTFPQHNPEGLEGSFLRRDNVGMISGGNATIYVADIDASVTFYSETLGLRLEFRAGDQWATIDAGQGFRLGLHPASEHQPSPGTPGGVTIGLAVDQPIEQVVATLKERGVVFQGPIIDEGIDEGMLKLAFFTDPDGNAFYLAESHM